MPSAHRLRAVALAVTVPLAVVVAVAVSIMAAELLSATTAQAAGGAAAGRAASSGGAPIGGLAPSPKPEHRRRKKVKHRAKNAHGKWLHGVTITEYWPAPEWWFVGRLVRTPGLPGKHRIDWLYSATGVSMQGEGIGLDGRMYHIDSLGDGGWVTAEGASTSPSDGWLAGSPYWRAGGYWTNRKGGVTFPLAAGGWSNGRKRKYIPLANVSFATGPSLPLHFYQSIAVDPNVIALGSRVYIPAYKHDGHGGWFVAQDTGGAIGGRHIDVYRSPPSLRTDSGQYLTSQAIYVVAPKS